MNFDEIVFKFEHGMKIKQKIKLKYVLDTREVSDTEKYITISNCVVRRRDNKIDLFLIGFSEDFTTITFSDAQFEALWGNINMMLNYKYGIASKKMEWYNRWSRNWFYPSKMLRLWNGKYEIREYDEELDFEEWILSIYKYLQIKTI